MLRPQMFANGSAEIADANAQTLSAAKLNKEIKEANDKLKKTKKAIADAESLLQASYVLKTFFS